MSDQSQTTPPGKENSGSDGKHDKPQKENPDVPNTLPAVQPQVQPTPDCKYRAEKEEKSLFEKCKPAVEVIALLAGIFLVGVNTFMWLDAKNNFKMDERAWVFVEPRDNALSVEGTNIFFTIFDKNLGKTPAVITGDVTKPEFDPDKIPPLDDEVVGEEVLLVPNQTLTIRAPLSPGDVAQIKNKPLYVFGTIFYKDIFGEKHWTQFCYSLTDMGAKTIQMHFHAATDDVRKINGK